MRGIAKMAMLSAANNDTRRYGGGTDRRSNPRSEYENEGPEQYEVEDRFRDRRGRDHYDNGRFAPMRGEMARRNEFGGMRYREDEPRNGGFAVWDRYDGGEARGGYWPQSPHTPPYYKPGMRGDGMNMIGFERGPEMHGDYRSDASYAAKDEMQHSTREKNRGYSAGSDRLTPEMAQEWTKGMHNEDGSKGPHWTIDQAKQVMQQRGISSYDPYEFWAVMNAIYSDYCTVLKKHGINNMDAYIDLTCAWLNDKDAVPNKAAVYFTEIVM